MPEPTPGGIPVLDQINKILSSAVPGLGTILALVEMGRQAFGRASSGEPPLTLAEMSAILVKKGGDIEGNARTWLSNNGYDEHGNKV